MYNQNLMKNFADRYNKS